LTRTVSPGAMDPLAPASANASEQGADAEHCVPDPLASTNHVFASAARAVTGTEKAPARNAATTIV
jgi:hypothetical protein